MRRDRVDIWRDILSAVRAASENEAPPSRIQSKVNLPHDRFWRHVGELEQRGLLERGPLRTTVVGDQFLDGVAQLRMLLSDEAGAP